MKATELINKFKQILTLSTEEVIDEAVTVEETVEANEEVTQEVENVEVNEVEEVSEEVENNEEEIIEEVIEEEVSEEVAEEVTEEVAEEVIEEEVEEEVAEEVIEEEVEINEEEVEEKEVDGNINEPRLIERDSTDYNLSEDSEETEEVTELAEEGDDKEEIVEDIQEAKEEIKYASAEELAGLKAEIKALGELLNNLNPKKDVPQELSAEDIKEEQVQAEGIAVSPEAEVVANPTPLAIKKGLRGASTKDVVWGKLFGNN